MKKEKILSIILSAVMVLTIIPIMGSEAYAAAYAKAGEVTSVTVNSETITTVLLK